MKTVKDLKSLVAHGKTVKFVRYCKNELWYQTDCGFEFPVPIEDTGDGVFEASDKAMIMMRYIRKHLVNMEKGLQECQGITA